MKKVKLLIASLVALFAVMAAPMVATAATPLDSIKGAVCNAAENDGTCDTSGASEDKVFGLVKKVIDIISIAVGAISVVMVVVGGFRYITSGGESGGVGSAKNTILYAIIGLVVVIFAQAIVKLVIDRL